MAKTSQKNKRNGQPETDTVLVDVPIGDLPPKGYELQQAESGRVSMRDGRRGSGVSVSLNFYDSLRACQFLRIRSGLRRDGAKLASGQPVWTNADTVRWLVEQTLG